MLTCGLLPCLRAAGSDARVVSVSSLTYKLALRVLGGVKEELFTFKDMMESGAKVPAPVVRYAHSKLAILLFGLALGRKESEFGVRVCIVDPGVALTSITRSLPSFIDKLWMLLFVSFSFFLFCKVLFDLTLSCVCVMNRRIGRDAEMGAQTAIHCCLAEDDQVKNGLYKDNKYIQCWPEVYSEEAQELLWKQTEQLIDGMNLPSQ